MTGSRQDRLHNLLPALYHQLDERQGQPLRALMAVLEGEFRRLEGDLAAAYDDWFITTCDDWVVPYIADLLGIRDLKDQKHFILTQRRRVANTIGYRRRKGAPAVLEHVIGDVTGWHARCVEFARQVVGTQHVAHRQPDSGRSVDVRQHRALAEVNGPFDSLAHTASVDNSNRGKFSLDRIGLYFWRLRSYPIRRSFAQPFEGNSGCYTFDPLGRDTPLFNHPQPVTELTQRAQDINLPLPLSRVDLAADLRAYRAQYKGVSPNSEYYGPDRGLCVECNGQPIPPAAVASADLSGWPDLAHLPDGAVLAIDVELGRVAFVDGRGQGDVRVNYNYGFSSDVGGGPYGKQFWLDEPASETKHTYLACVAKGGQEAFAFGDENGGDKGDIVDTLKKALEYWERHCDRSKNERPIGRIIILDNGVYEGPDLPIYLPRGARLTIAAADGVRPIIGPRTTLVVTTIKPEVRRVAAARPSEKEERVIDRLLHLNGLVIDGGMQIGTGGETFEGKLDVEIQHGTLMPDGLGVQFQEEDAKKLRVDIQHSIVGPLRLPAQVAALAVEDSIIDHSGGYAIAAPAAEERPDPPPEQVPGPPVKLERTTVFGKVSVQELPSASEVIFTEPVFVEKRERGGVSFSYVPVGSQTPPREFCQPPDDASASKVRPRFTSVRFGDPAYAQLGLDCPSELRRGGRDGTEMGVFNHLHRPQREINLGHILDEYLPFGISVAIFYVT